MDDQPSPAADLRTSWADIPTLDRRTALSVLHWSALDDPEQTPREAFEALILKVAQAEALRPTDLGQIARRVLLRAILDTLRESLTDNTGAALERFLRRAVQLLSPLRATGSVATSHLRPEDAPAAEALAAAREFLAVMTGLERLITSAPENNPTFSDRVQGDISRAKTTLLEWILNHALLARLEGALVIESGQAAVAVYLGAQLEIQRASLEERAARAVRFGRGPGAFQINARPKTEAPRRTGAEIIKIGWLRTFAPDGLADLTSQKPDQIRHTIAAGAQVEGLGARPPILPIASLSRAITSLAEQELQTLPGTAEGGAARIAATFRALAGVAPVADHVAQAHALPAFLALSAGPGQSEALGRRPGLLQSAIPGAAILPVPPLTGQPGVFCYKVQGSQRQVHAVFVEDVDDPQIELPHDLEWQEDMPVSGLRRWTADLPPHIGFLLDPHDHRRLVDDDLETIADVIEGLIRRYRLRGEPRAPLVHVFSLMGPVGRAAAGVAEAGYFSLSWRIDRADAERLILERRGDGLAVQRSPHAGAELWRIGQSVSDLFAIPHEAEAEDGGVKRDRRLLRDRLKRTALARLRGRWIHAGQVTAALATGTMPRVLERIVKALREISGGDDRASPLALEFLLSGRAMHTRKRLGGAVEIPGGWARFLEMFGGGGLRSGDDDGLFAHAAMQLNLARPSRALVRAGDTVDAWAAQAEAGRSREALSAMGLGFEIAALRLDLRDLALAILARLSPQGRERLGRVRPHLGSLEGLGAMLLVDPRFGHGESAGRTRGDEAEQPWGYEGEWQRRELFVTLHEALGLRALQGRAQLERISTAGWLMVLSVMAGALDFEMETILGEAGAPLRPAFFPLANPAAATPLKALAIQLLRLAPAPTSGNADAWPWELTSTVNTTALRQAITAARTSLDMVREAAGVVTFLDPLPLRSLAVGEQGADFYTADGHHYVLPWWRCALTATVTERIDRTETMADGDRRLHPCSFLADENGVLVLQVVSESLSKVTGLQALGKGAALPEDSNAADVTAETQASHEPACGPPTAEPTAHEHHARDPTDRDEPAAGTLVSAAVADPFGTPTPSAIPPARPPMPATPEGAGAVPLGAWREHQDRSWRRRAQGSGLAQSGYGRVAILQYDFLDSYDAEKLPKYLLDREILDPDLRVALGVVDLKLSFEEHRRRQVLAAVVSCCQSLGVEALVLPEYSAPPETVSWLEQHCRQRDYSVSIWAGTFRQQPGFALGLADGCYHPVALDAPKIEAHPMETHLSVIFRETQNGAPISFLTTGDIADEAPIFRQTLAQGVRHRQKKYPSIGMGEEFKPSTAVLEPLMSQSRSVQRIESYVSELVCSELFVFNGPLNWRSFAEHLAASSVRYKLDGEAGVDRWVDHIIKDAKSAALFFSGADGLKPRRSLLFVTCATTRDADYHYFAQSAYLASGIVTAFCNGSGQGVTGGSCFVGQGGWETRGDGLPVPNPYHGATPGILSNGLQRGALGPRENALIVADIRPDRTVDDKPRSQALGAPMRLVAHIPIVEGQSSSRVKGHWDSAWYRPRRATWVDHVEVRGDLLDPEQHPQLLHNAASDAPIDLDTFVGRMLGVLKEIETAGSTLELDTNGRNRAIAATVSLSGLFAGSPGMRWRAAALAKDHQSLPERLPCPCLLDWLIVDLDLRGFENQLRALRDLAHPMAEDKKKRKKVIDFSDLTPALRDAPWRWVACKREADERGNLG